MNIKTWKQITNFSKYEISIFGNIRNKLTNKLTNTLIKPVIKSGCYHVSLLCDDNSRKSCRIPRLVALEYIKNIENKETINHIKSCKYNIYIFALLCSYIIYF